MDTKGMITHSNPKSPISEAYRVLRTNIQYSSFDTPLKTIVITSSGPGEGKTTTIINIAITFAQMGSRVLLIDADLRRPRVHKVFEINSNNGLTNFLAMHDDYKDYLKKCPIENLDILTCGAIPPNPSELLISNAMKQFVQKAREDYDMVFIDAPPVGTVTDAAILSTIADGTIIVAKSGEVEAESLLRSKELLQNVKANIIGVVLNHLDKSAKGNYYYYYYYYYGENNQPSPNGKNGKKNKRQVPQV